MPQQPVIKRDDRLELLLWRHELMTLWTPLLLDGKPGVIGWSHMQQMFYASRREWDIIYFLTNPGVWRRVGIKK